MFCPDQEAKDKVKKNLFFFFQPPPLLFLRPRTQTKCVYCGHELVYLVSKETYSSVKRDLL